MLNIRLTPTTASVVKADVTTTLDLPTAARMSTPLPTADLGTCEDCKSDLSALRDNNGEIRTVFCEYCEFGN
ncbi:hypothetical protein ABTX60_07045 [Streptomyces sp. NPDC126510]|uniref:hypothetical protein n=1 Tax=Streptomyces sp. NPDC126510 TaxID=3155317 RepID=UPI00332BF530